MNRVKPDGVDAGAGAQGEAEGWGKVADGEIETLEARREIAN